tara:strand:- start:35799 stop:36011 length:213 start_codon:yes stop_codon:yes gene_type:complete
MKILKVMPKEGIKVPYPMERRFLPEKGAEVPASSYWIKRLNEGDIIEVKDEAKKEVKKTKTKTKTMEAES